MSKDDLLTKIRGFLDRDDVHMSENTFGLRAVNDGKLLDRLNGGGSVTLKTVEKIEQYIGNYRAPVAAGEQQVQP